MDFRGQPEILNAEDYGLSGTEPVINQECMLVHEKSGHYVKLSGTAIIDNITASNSLFEAVFLYNRKLHFLLYKKPPAGLHEVSLCLPDWESLIFLNWKILFIYVTMIIHKSN